MALACQMLLGLQHPLYAAGLGLAWSVGKWALVISCYLLGFKWARVQVATIPLGGCGALAKGPGLIDMFRWGRAVGGRGSMGTRGEGLVG